MLDVGAGSGYFTSVCYHLVRSSAQQQQQQQGGGTVVVGIEHIPALTALAEQNIRADGLGTAIDDEQGIVLVTGDGRLGVSISSNQITQKINCLLCWSLSDLAGYAQKGPYDAIHVGAAARTIPPALVEQLASPGRMIIPVGTYSQRLMQVDKDAQGKITQRDLFGVVVRTPCPFRDQTPPKC